MSNIDFMMESKENMRDNTGIDGRQATLPKESSTQDEDKGWSQGSVRIPLAINQSIMVNCNVDSIEPTIAFNSVVFCSNSRNFNLSLLVGKLFLSIRSFMYIKVGRNGKKITVLL